MPDNETIERIAEKWVTCDEDDRGTFGVVYHVCIGKFVAETFRDKAKASGTVEFVQEILKSALTEMRTIALREAAEIARKVANLEAAESDSQKEQEHYQRSNRRKSRAAVAFNIANEIEELGRIDK